MSATATQEAVSRGRRTPKTASFELRNLIGDVEDLIKRVANVSDADVAKLRARVEEKITSAKDTLKAGTAAVSNAASATDDYVHESPWQSVGIAAIAGLAVGYLLGRR
jgi:ElaB/YqjD/DUF883 family membrane-anchored ribosome-binding protein